jgi:glycosyltransferase involved in cell wall biosynthesis
VVNEAMASGLPVLVSSQSGCSEDLVRPAENGFTFDAAVPEELTERLCAVGRLERTELAEMGRRSREIIAEYSPANWANEVARVAQA